MLSFESDYTVGAHEEILKRLFETNMVSQPGYGFDEYTLSAKEKIRKACGRPEADVFFISGGTQTNVIVISAVLGKCEGVIAANTGHINGHEAGAVESRGHKVISLPHHNGKIDVSELKAYIEAFYQDSNHEHMVYPGMVYISHPTEYGTLYSKAELCALSEICHSYDMPLFMDGARLGYALMSRETDVTLKDISELCDVFYIGGTKVGALCGEAVVFPRGNAPKRFFTYIKQQGALLAKGRLLGVQFDTLFTDDLYYKISANAIDMAEKLKDVFTKKGYTFFLKSPTNQQFILLSNDKMKALSEKVRFSFWEAPDSEHTVVRFATSWATTNEELEELSGIL